MSYLDWYEAKTHCCNEHPNQDDSFLCSQTHLVNKAHLDGVSNPTGGLVSFVLQSISCLKLQKKNQGVFSRLFVNVKYVRL